MPTITSDKLNFTAFDSITDERLFESVDSTTINATGSSSTESIKVELSSVKNVVPLMNGM